LDEQLDEASGSHKGNVCCEGLVKETRDGQRLCVKQYCVENSDLGISFEGDPRGALPCCDDSANRRIISKISGFIVHCVDQNISKDIDHSNRCNSKSDFSPDFDFRKKNFDSIVIPQ
jgi:hypothetical protein